MDANRYEHDLDDVKSSLKRQQWTTLGTILALILTIFNSYLQFGRERTIVVPPTVERSFWIEGGTVSTEYLEQMSLWVASLVLDVTPSNVAYKNELLLQFVAPSAHGTLKEAGELAAVRLKRDNASTQFDLETMRTDTKRLAALMSGKLETYINGQRVSSITRHYLVAYRIASGRAYITAFKEVPHGDLNAALAEL
ncbi:type IV conjugative transfer system protein TraE [Thauera butanivorans]|uniref:type IV conjugative transfer system protein TraE n=1 Tax=Thauera butanivorans TaxID=86174 RepID=UPI0008393955|nr:type IV conjugative transfer system protein TraE [Thauera butanivorans]